MELKDRKRIINRLPGFLNGTEGLPGSMSGNTQRLSGADIIPIASLVQQGVTNLVDGIMSGRQSSDSIRLDAGTSTAYSNGIAYEQVNNIDLGLLNKDYDRKMGLSFITNPLKGFGMLFTRRKHRRAVRNAAIEASKINLANMSGASSTYLQQDYALEYGNPQSLMLYAKNGKEAVHTSEGELNIIPNSKTEGGEIVYNKLKGTAHIIPGTADGDNNYASILPSDTIITNRFGLANKARNAAKALESVNKKKLNRGVLGALTDEFIKNQATSVLDNVTEEQRQYRNAGMLPQPKLKRYKTGVEDFTTYSPFLIKDPGLANIDRSLMKQLPVDYNVNYRNRKTRRFPSNWWIDGLGALTHTGNLIADSLLRVKRSNTYRPNPYANNALSLLASLNINPYPINKQLMDQERRNLYAINHMGGLSSAQKAYASIASGLGTLNSIASSNAKIQEQNNAYKSAYANAAINVGEADRRALTAANQWDLDYYSKSHAAKQQMIQQDIYNALAALQQGYKNSFDRYTFDNIMSRYTS